MPLDDADRSRLEEIERALTRDAPEVARVLSAPHGPVRPELAVPVLSAAAVFLAALVTLAVLVGSMVPVLLGLPPVAITLALLRWPHFARADGQWEPPPEPWV